MTRIYVSLVLLCALFLGGCLTASRKVIRIELNADGSGKGSMVFLNVMSMQEADEDQSLNDYTTLVNRWLNGDEFEQANPNLNDVQKRIAGDGNRLNAEVTFSFAHYSDVGLYRYNNTGPWMYYSRLHTSNIEFFDTSNGQYGGTMMPVVFWPEETRDFRIATIFDHGKRPVYSLFSLYEQLGLSVEEDD